MALSAVVLGLVVLLAYRAPRGLAVAIVSFCAVFHGHAHGTELPQVVNALAFGLGFVTSTGLLHIMGISIETLQHGRTAGPLIVRACGVLVATLGVLSREARLAANRTLVGR